MAIYTFPYPVRAKTAWDSWDEGREKLEKIIGAKVVLVEGWGTSREEYNLQKAHPMFTTSYYPRGADFYLMQEEEALKSTQPEQLRCLRHMVPGGIGFYLSGCITMFNLTQFPSCCGLCLSYTTMVRSEWQKKGIGSRVMGTLTIPTQAAEKKIWDRSGWKVVEEWKNARSGNVVVTGQKSLLD